MIRVAVDQFNQEQVSWVFHCGDWVSPFILSFFQGLKAPLRGVFGNNDGDKFRHLAFKDKWGVDVAYEDRFIDIEIDHRRIAVFHGDYPGITDALVACGHYDVVFHGHTHQIFNQLIGKTLSLNPGSLMKETSSKIKGSSIAIYDTDTNMAKHIMLT
jgi:putative phosphoesterase